MSILPKLISRFKTIPIKQNPNMTFSVEFDKLLLKFIRIQNSQQLFKKNKVVGLIQPDIQTYYKGTVMKTV